MTGPTFVDTNVWVYAVDGQDRRKQALARAALADRSDLVISAQILSEFFVTVTRKLARPVSPPVAREMVDRLARLPVVALDAHHVGAAIDGSAAWGISYWDALVIAAAASAGCVRILSEDLADGATYGSVVVESPFRHQHRVSEAADATAYDTRPGPPWDDQDLQVALDAYQHACRAAGMRPNAIHAYWDYARRFLDWRTGDFRPRGATVARRPTPSRAVEHQELLAQVDVYGTAIEAAGRRPQTVETYTRHARFFVRWLGGTFQPGARLR